MFVLYTTNVPITIYPYYRNVLYMNMLYLIELMRITSIVWTIMMKCLMHPIITTVTLIMILTMTTTITPYITKKEIITAPL